MDNLGNVLTLMCAVIVGGCLAWGLAARLIARRRAVQVEREFRVPTDRELIEGMRRLSRAAQPDRHWRTRR